MNINEFLNNLKANNSRLFKEAELTKHKDNDLLKKVIFLALDPFTNFYIRKIPKYNQIDITLDLNEALNRLEFLSNRTYTGNAGIDWLRKILESLDEQDALVIERVIKKDLSAGFSSSTTNKIWKDLIKVYPVALATPYSDKLFSKIDWNKGVLVQTKEDGMRFNAICTNGTVEFRSRNGKLIDLLGHLEQDFMELATRMSGDVVFDGELVVYDEHGNVLPRKEGNGILNKAVKGTISDEEASRVGAKLWDYIPYQSFINSKCNIEYEFKFGILEDIVDDFEKIKLVDNYKVHSPEEAQLIFNIHLSEGKEGVIVKLPNIVWEDKRLKGQIKMKNELECDLLCVGWEPGKKGSKYENMIGNLIVMSADEVIKTGVGTGLKDEDRVNPEQYVGKIITVKYNERITKKDGGYESLFLPVYVEVRLDKTVADSSKDVK